MPGPFGYLSTATEETLRNVSDKIDVLTAAIGAFSGFQVRYPTYSATSMSFASAANATDIFTIYGSATKTIRITKIKISATKQNNGTETIILLKRSTQNAGGTATVHTNVGYDSSLAAGTAIVRSYTANPAALGTLVGSLKSERLFISTANGGHEDYLIEFGIGNGDLPVLRGVDEGLCINLNGVTVVNSVININIEWTEQ